MFNTIVVLSRKMVQAGFNGFVSRANSSYEDAVKALNGLQSNASYLRSVKKHNSNSNGMLDQMRKYIQRSGMSLEELDRLSVIHVAGTKGKGSACAFTECVLRAHGFRTGLYTSPHLVNVRERIKINGKSINEEKFSNYFWKLYDILEKNREYDSDMPLYFKFLTLLMFHVFANERIDVAVIEVGIGGEHDCTNIVRNPVCVGITSLGIDHTNVLGETLEEIAYQKCGIFKKGAMAFSVPQPMEATRILEKRAREKNCRLKIVSSLKNNWPSGETPKLGISGDFQYYNASIAISMVQYWMSSSYYSAKKLSSFSYDLAAAALSRCEWPGRMQILRGRTVDFYLDGAHTVESTECCARWFADEMKNSPGKRILVFNTTGNRDSVRLLEILRPLNFHEVYFVPNIAGKIMTIDQIDHTVNNEEIMLRCERHRVAWGDGAHCADNVSQVFDRVTNEKNSSIDRARLLVTGSLHLVGAALVILDPDLTMSTKF